MVAKRVENGAVVAAGTAATCRNNRWNPGVSGYEKFDVLLDKAFQWMVPGAENVLWYEGYGVYNDTGQCSQLIEALSGKGYTVVGDSTEPITASLLVPYDILIIPELQLGGSGGDPTLLHDADVDAIVDFVENGGGLLIMEQSDYFDHNYYKVQNKILTALDFGIYFQSDQINDLGSYQFDADVENIEFGENYRTETEKNKVRVYSVCSLAERKDRDVSVSISPKSRTGQPETTLAYSVTVTNKGDLTDTYDLVATDTAGWTLDIENTVGPLSTGASDTVTLGVTVPDNAENGQDDMITVKATSQADNDVWGSDNCVAHVGEVETIVILHTNDIHGHLLPYESDIGGSFYIASIVDNERAQNPGRVLLLDAGDIVDGAPIGDLFYGRSVIEVMNAIGFDAMTVGNHELDRYGGDYDYGVIPIENDYLMDLKEAAEFPMLAANVLINGSKPFESYVIKEVDNVKIGIIGVTTQFWPPENVQILDPISAAQACVDEIENETDLIIALTHLGFDPDKSLASNVENIDIIIGGHSHTVRWEPENIGDTKIVQAGAYGKYVGRIRLEFDAENHGNYNFSYNLIEVKHPPLDENQGIAEMVENYDNIISPIVDVEIGYTKNALFYTETGENVAESFRENTGADVGYQNYGGIRNYMPAGDITIRHVHKVLPYGNKLMSMDLRGDYLKDQFEHGYVAGAYKNNSQWYLENGEPIEDSEYYRVATNDYVGTRYEFTNGKNITYHGLCRDAFIDYVKKVFPVADPNSPIHIHLTWGQNDTSHTMVVTWKTATAEAGDNVLYDTESRGGDPELYGYSATGSHHTYTGAGGYIHDVELTGLSPDTRYYFICGGENDGYSAERSFRTAPDQSASFRFVAGGDSRSGLPNWPEKRDNISRTMAKFNPSFVLFIGDFIYNWNDQNEWNNWFAAAQEYWVDNNGLTIPMIPAIGNHEVFWPQPGDYNPENEATNYYGQFYLPGNERWYSLDWGPDLHVIVLDSEVLDTGSDTWSDQLAWLENDLAANENSMWKIVIFHRPAYSSGGGLDGAQTDWVPLFDNYHVDLAISGHHHCYERTHPIKNNQISDNGTVYVVSGGWGAPLHSGNPEWFTAYGPTAIFHFVIIDIFEKTLHLRAVNTDGETFDELYIPKGPKVSVSISPSENSGLLGTTLNYTVTVINMGNVVDNYALTVSDNAVPSWNPTLSENLLENVRPGENRIVALSVVISENAEHCMKDNITVVATSAENIEISDSASCTAHAITFSVGISVSPTWQENFQGSTLDYTVIVANTGLVIDNYILTVSDSLDWILALSDLLEDVQPGENGTVTLTVTIPENAEHCTEDNITVTATSIADNKVSESDSCIAHAISPKAMFSFVTLYKVNLDLNLYFENGSKLVVKFYTYADAFENENVFWSGATPTHVAKFENVRHPENIGVKKARLDLTTDNTENVISTIASLVVRRDDLFGRIMEIKGLWPIASPDERNALFQEIMDIKGQWPIA